MILKRINIFLDEGLWTEYFPDVKNRKSMICFKKISI